MKLRHLVPAAALILVAVAAHAQTQGNVGLYLNPVAVRISNSVVDNSSFSFLGKNSTSQVFYGFDMGGYYDFFHAGKLAAGMDLRFSDQHAANAGIREYMFGLRVSGSPFSRPIKPYIEAAFGEGSTKPQAGTVRVGKPTYGVYGGVDYTLARHIDLRAIEIGYGSLTTVSSATVGSGGNVAIPSSKLLSFSSGFVFRF